MFMNEIQQKISGQSLQSAKVCIAQGNYGRAFAHFLLVLKLSPHKKSEIKGDYSLAMREWTEKLEKEGRMADLFLCYEQTCDLFPENEVALNNVGAQLFRLGYVDEATMYIRKSLAIAPDYIPALENLENVCSHLVERWHFRMLNDSNRNRGYRDAIQQAVKKGHQQILDIGTGTGILSLFAVSAGARHVYACEESKTMHDVARDVFSDNNIADRVTLVQKTSTNITIPEDIPDRVSCVVTETFDAGLFGERILTTLQHAWKELLIPQNPEIPGVGGTVIPKAATIHFCAIECDSVHRENRFLYPVLPDLEFNNTDIQCSTGNIPDEPYTTENLSLVSGGYRKLSEVIKLMDVDFHDIHGLNEMLCGIVQHHDVCITTSGRVDAIAAWFDLHLDDTITITTSPVTNNCWEQAIFPVIQHTKNIDIKEKYFLKEHDVLKIECSIKDEHMKLKCLDIVKANAGSSCSFVDFCHLPDVQTRKLYLSRQEIRTMNDLLSNKLFYQALKLLKSENTTKDLRLTDLTYGLSPLCLQALKCGYTGVTVIHLPEDLRETVQYLAQVNELKSESIQFASDNIANINQPCDVILADLIEPCGTLHQQVLEDIALLRVKCLRDNGLVIPGCITVYGVCIESEDLLRDSAVACNENTLGFNVAKFINDFKMSTHVDLDLRALPHKKLTAPFELMSLDLNEPSNGDALPSFLSVTKDLQVEAIDSGQLTAMVFWFDMCIYRDIRLCTLDSRTHWKQAAVTISGDHSMISGQSISLQVLLRNSTIRIKVSTPS